MMIEIIQSQTKAKIEEQKHLKQIEAIKKIDEEIEIIDLVINKAKKIVKYICNSISDSSVSEIKSSGMLAIKIIINKLDTQKNKKLTAKSILLGKQKHSLVESNPSLDINSINNELSDKKNNLERLEKKEESNKLIVKGRLSLLSFKSTVLSCESNPHLDINSINNELSKGRLSLLAFKSKVLSCESNPPLDINSINNELSNKNKEDQLELTHPPESNFF